MSDFQGDVTAWLQATGQLTDVTDVDSGPCAYPSCDCDGPDGPACGRPGYAEIMNRTSLFGPVAKWGRLEFPLPEFRATEPEPADPVQVERARILAALVGLCRPDALTLYAEGWNDALEHAALYVRGERR